MKIAIGADHAGYDLKELVKQHLLDNEHHVLDFGTHGTASVDYPDYAHQLAQFINNQHAEKGILLCGSANGVAITANKHSGIRAAICWTNEIAELARMHNDANVICIPARYVSKELALEMVHTFLNTPFEGGRHQKRVNKIEVRGGI